MNLFIFFFEFIVLVLPLLLAVALLTLAERKVLASIQRRRGPTTVGFLGLLQPFADGIKLVLKETVYPIKSDFFVFFLSPVLTFSLALLGWAVIPIVDGHVVYDVNLGILYIFAVSSLGVYGIIMSGWSSNSRYALLGSLRSAAQMISYEVSLGLILVNVVFCSGSFNLTEIILFQHCVWFVFPLFPLFVMFFVSSLAETNRPPFDLPEAEAELVSGYNVEYSAAGFALFFIAEYSNIILMSSLSVIFFFGGWMPPIDSGLIHAPFFWFFFKLLIVLFLFIWVRSSFPRYRYDQLMQLGWKSFLPLSIGWVLITSGLILGFTLIW